ncbi:DnaJ domain-containing protein [Bacteroides ovatus]|uniref:DnaJ domain-containing protein n=1 Tax=Bacteroides ovatus TaxID=28116 RepID=UPI00321BB173
MKHDATEAEIKAAYKQAAKSAHPDAGGSNEKMQEVNAAWEVLGNAQKRAEYDARMAA